MGVVFAPSIEPLALHRITASRRRVRPSDLRNRTHRADMDERPIRTGATEIGQRRHWQRLAAGILEMGMDR